MTALTEHEIWHDVHDAIDDWAKRDLALYPESLGGITSWSDRIAQAVVEKFNVTAKLSGGAGEVAGWRWECFEAGCWETHWARSKPDLEQWRYPTRWLEPLYLDTPPGEPAVVPAEGDCIGNDAMACPHCGGSGHKGDATPAPVSDDLVGRLDAAYKRYQTELAKEARDRITDLQAEVGRKDEALKSIAFAAHFSGAIAEGEERAAWLHIERLANAAPVMSGWLIEQGDSPVSHPLYLAGYGDGRPGSWSEDHLQAIRFARKDDADRALTLLDDEATYRVCQHAWDDGRRAALNAGECDAQG